MKRLFRKDPLLHGIFIFCAPIFIGIFLIVSLYVYGFIRLFDPNYEEFGPQVVLYQAKDCADINTKWFFANNSCYISHWIEGMYKNHQPTLNKVVERAANTKKDLFHRLPQLSGYPAKAEGWNCSAEGKVIPDLTTEVASDSILYKCWPK